MNDKNILLPQLIVLKKKDKFSISGKLDNKDIIIEKNDIKNFIDEDFLAFDFKKLFLVLKSNFDFDLDKKFRLKNFNLNTEIKLNNLEFKNSLKLNSFFPDIKENIKLESHLIKLNYSKKLFQVLVVKEMFLFKMS